MKIESPTLLAALGNPTTTWCFLWKITRQDGVVLGFTDHDRDLVYSGVTYLAATGFVPSAVQGQNDLAPTNLEVTGVLDSSAITADDVRAGVYDFAEVRIMIADWSSPATPPQTISRGRVGNISLKSLGFVAELQGLKGLFDKYQFIRFYDIPCDPDFADRHGENRCTLDPASFTETGTVTATTDDQTFTATVTGTRPAGGFDNGMITWSTGANSGRKLEVKSFDNGATGILVLWLPSADAIAVGDTFSILMGCDKSLPTCRDRYNNVLNHRGFPFVPGLDAALQTPNAS
jgi:uncharacterized phage protein (TIGR02218 family)